MKSFKLFLGLFFSISISISAFAALPEQPMLEVHPGSGVYQHEFLQQSVQISGRTVDVFLPSRNGQALKKSPVIVYGHGQATSLDGYNETFRHLARKGIAVIFPQYDKNFFDQDWGRMADDFNLLTQQTISRYSDNIDSNMVVFSGHSKGAYIALMAAGAPVQKVDIQSIVLFEPAGYNPEYLKRVKIDVPVTLTWGDKDTVTPLGPIKEIYEKLPSKYKQLIQLSSYTNVQPILPADHFFVLNKKFFFGGMNGISPFHFFGSWKWLVAAVWDLQDGAKVNNSYIYGFETESTGDSALKHQVLRSW